MPTLKRGSTESAARLTGRGSSWTLGLAVFAALLALSSRLPAQKADPRSLDLEARARAFVDRLAAGDYVAATADFDQDMKKQAPPVQLERIWLSLCVRFGKFESREGCRREPFQQYEFVFVRCRFERRAVDIKVVFNRKGEIAGFFTVPAYSPPDYARRDAFREEPVEFGDPGWRLPGTLTLPRVDGGDGGRFPAVVLVHGSGPNDRDETLGPNRPFQDLAWGLGSRGIAVLRYDKRTKQHGTKMAKLARMTVREETIDDALLAVKLLRDRPEIDPKRVFVLGHSLGAMLAPRIARRDDTVAGLLILAGPTRPLGDLMVEQYEYIFSLDGKLTSQEKKKIESLKRMARKVKSPELSDDTPRSEIFVGAPPSYWIDLRGYRPAEVASRIGRPMLILQGERDYQVTMVDFQGWKDALGDRDDVRFKSFPGLNHLFIPGKGRSTPGEYQQPGHVDEAVIRTIEQWIKGVS